MSDILGNSVKSFSSGHYSPPTPSQLKYVISYGELDKKTVAAIVGSSYNDIKQESSTIRGWLNGTRPIPYPCWRLLLLKVGFISIDEI